MVISNREFKKKTGAQQGPLVQGGGLLPKDETETVDYSDLQNVSKSSLTRIEVSHLPKEIPDFNTPGATKDSLITAWLRNWIVSSLKDGKLTESHLLPRKADIAKYLGVSIGTVQNAIRFVEDEGHVESKQRIGTLIRNAGNDGQRMRKQTSKRDQAVVAIRKFIIQQGIQPGESLPSAREIAVKIGSAPNTTRLALEFLANEGVLENRGTRGNKANWGLLEVPAAGDDASVAIESDTLIDQLERDLKALIAEEFAVNEKLPSHLELASRLKVSIKTVHDAMRRLCEQGIVSSKRGRYGTYVLRRPDAEKLATAADTSIFLPAEEASFYNYEKVEKHLMQLIKQQYKVGDKLPAMGKLADELNVSSNTIRKALQNLGQQGLVSFSRGRYGGTFVKQLPEVEASKSLTWVSVNPQTAATYGTHPANR